MNMLKLSALTVVLFACSLSLAFAEGIEANWRFLGATHKKASGVETNLVWKFSSGKISWEPDNPSGYSGIKYSGRYRVFNDTTPKRIDCWRDKFRDGQLLRTTYQKGIYKIEGDRLYIKFSKDETSYPKEFKWEGIEREEVLEFETIADIKTP